MDMIEKIEAALKKDRGCLCAWYEHCETCSSFSAYNKLREEIREAIHGPAPKPTLEDYGRVIVLNADDIFFKVKGEDHV